jgi:hypothetical protein
MRDDRRSVVITSLAVLATLLAGCGTTAGTAMVPQHAIALASRNGSADGHGACAAISNSQDFNGKAIRGGSWIWFSSVLAAPRASETLEMTDSQIFLGDGKAYYLIRTPSMRLTLDSSSQLHLSGPRNGGWRLIAPEHTSGKDLLDAVAFRVPSTLRGSIKNVNWSAKFYSNSRSDVRWQWGAAVYSTFTRAYERVGIKPLDDRRYPPHNSDPAGTPEDYKGYVIGGGTGSGGDNYTGSLGRSVTVKPCV